MILENLEFKFACLSASYEVDETFDSDKYIKLRLRVCHDGVNPNMSEFDILDMDKAKDSINNIPLLANVVFSEDEDTDPDFGSHDIAIEEDKMNEGEYRVIYKESPIGVVPETNNYEVSEFDGKNYVFVDCFVYRGYSNYAEDIINRDKDIKLSMEIIVDAYHYDNKTKVYQITDYRYKGITLLGKKYGTGMEHALATINDFSNDSAKEIASMSVEIEGVIAQTNGGHSFGKISKDDINNFNEQNGKKEVDGLDEKLKLLEDYGLSVEKLDFSIDDLTMENLKAKLDGLKAKADEDKEKQFALVGQFIDEIRESLSVEMIESEWGQYCKFSFVDFDDEKSEVYFWDRSDWKLYGASFSKDGDSVKIDMETKKRMKFAIEPFNEGVDSDFSFEGAVKDVFETVTTKATESANAIKSEFDTYKETYKTAETEVDELRTFKEDKLSEEYETAVEAVFSNFEEKLASIEEFKTLKENYSEMSTDEIQKECFAILGRQNFTFAKVTKKDSVAPRIPIHTPSHDENLYGGIFSVYGKSKN